jgi:hypothetical protein
MLKTTWAVLYRALQLILLALFAYGFAQTLPFDLAVLFAGDMLLYLEVATAVWLAAQVTRVRVALDYSRAVAPLLLTRVRRRAARARRAVTRKLVGRNDSADDRHWVAFASA